MTPDLPSTTDRRASWARISERPNLLDDICAHLASGGTLIDLAEAWDIPLGWVSNWLRGDPVRSERFNAAEIDRGEWVVARILREVQRIAIINAKDFHAEDGKLRPVSEWSPDMAAAVTTIEYGSGGRPGKIKLVSKLAALELLGKEIGLFRPQVDVNLNVNIADGLKKARQRAIIVPAEVLSEPKRVEATGGGDFDGGPTQPTVPAQNFIKNKIPGVPPSETQEATQ